MPKVKKSKAKNFKSFDEFVDDGNDVKDIPVKFNFDIKFKNGVQKLAWNIYQQHDIIFLLGAAGTGKALPLNATLFNRVGPILMKDVQIGDEIANPDGSFSKITGIYPQGKKQVYRIYFHDKTSVDCCGDHLWQIGLIGKNNENCDKIVDTKFIAKNCHTSAGRRKFYIKTCKPVNFDTKNYKIDPYLMGILISEGNLTNSNCSFTSSDKEVVDLINNKIDFEYECKPASDKISYRIVKKIKNNNPNIYKEELKSLGLWGCMSYEKYIPKDYFYGDISQRVALLQGLMDGDGTVDKRTGSISFSTSSFKLSEDFCQLIYSLGGTTKVCTKEKCGYKNKEGIYVKCRSSYICHVNLPNNIKSFLLPRKLKLIKARSKYFPKRYIDRVEILDSFVEMQCISVDHKDQLYLTDNYAVTHNTYLATAFAIGEILNKTKKKIILTRPVVEAGESLGYLSGTFDEKINPYMRPLWDCLEKICGPTNEHNRNREIINKSYEVAPLAYMRGCTFDNSVCILDESQNCTRSQLKLFLTRMGENSKMIITGDPKQSDLGGIPDLVDVVCRLESITGVGVVHFNEECIVRHPLVGEVIKRLEK